MQDLKTLSKKDLILKLSESVSNLEDSQDKSDMEQLAHDLQTHHIELEMQNRELREAQNKLEESRNRFADLYDFAPIGYLTLNNKGCVTEINLTSASKIGVERAYIIDQPMTRWIAPKYRRRFLEHLEEVFNKKCKSVLEAKLVSRAGEDERDVHFESVLFLEDENKAFCRTAMIDITKRKKKEAQLILAKQEAESANKAKSVFLSRMSHELRTPLNAILGFGQLLELDNTNMSDEQKEGIKHILDGGNHLLALINDVLDIARIDEEKVYIKMQDVLLDEALNSAVLLTQSIALKHSITIQVPSETRLLVRADQRRLIQVLINLISNAVKYNYKGEMVSIKVLSLRDGLVRISIVDNGYGIKTEDQAEIFKPFQRISDKKEYIEGSGIGLTVTKKLIEAMDGRIGLESEYNKGSTFWIELPLSDGMEDRLAVE